MLRAALLFSGRLGHTLRASISRTSWLRYFDAVTVTVTGGTASTTAMGASTETAQFKKIKVADNDRSHFKRLLDGHHNAQIDIGLGAV
jgi:hypothetical protein